MLNKMQLQTLRTLVERASSERLHALVQSNKVPAQDEEYQFYQELLGKLKAQASLDNGWISVDGCPPKKPSILDFCDDGTICGGHSCIKNDGYTDLENNGSYKITHWQHLHQPKRVNMKNQPSPLQSLIDELGKEVAELKELIKGIHQISGICAFVYANNIITKIEVLERVIKMLGENK